ncbi:MAG: MFS transporter [Fuerstiella sp.]|nr:MFS transporter [Fuerstiella sp.]
MANTAQSDRPTRFRWTVFAMACGTSWMLYLHRYMFALIKPELKQQWNLGSDELGYLDSAFSLCYLVFQIPLGALADVAGAHLILTLLILLWSVGLGMHAWAPTVRTLGLARAILGTGQSAVFACLSRISRTWTPADVRTSAQGMLGVFFGRLGGLTTYLVVGSLVLGVMDVPWRTVVYWLAGIGVGFGSLFAVLFRNSPRQHRAVNEAEAELIEEGDDGENAEPRSRLSFREMFCRMSPRSIINLGCLNLQTILSALADNIYSAWIPLFLFEVHDLEFRQMGMYSSLPLLGGAIGGAIGGFLNDFLIRRTGNLKWSRRAVGLAGKGTAGILLAVSMLWYDDPQKFCLMLFAVKFFSDWSLTTTWGAVTDIGGHTTATVFAFNNTVATLGAVAAPLLYGNVAEHHGWAPVFYVGAGAYIVCAITWFGFDSTIPVISKEHPID